MYASPSYPPPDWPAVRTFVERQVHGKLVATGADGYPTASLIPYRYVPDPEGGWGRFEVHLVQGDPTLEALAHRPQAGFLVDDFLAFTPHHVLDPDDAGLATLHFYAVMFRVDATVLTDPAEVAAVLERLVARYEPDARWAPLADDDRYGPRLRRLAAAVLTIRGYDAKFKVGQNRTPEERRRLAAYLRAQGDPLAARAARHLDPAGPS
ncbi:MAG: FMN-binding negative transcriptional regulator [Actinomycetia bacterium]|nr:FMN-binding negative transcriptional regulator [Actinomycetes bacterium]